MCNPLEVIDVYRYNKEDIKRARSEHNKRKKKKMIKLEDPSNFDLHNSLSQWISENVSEHGLQQIKVLTAGEYENMLENGLLRDDTLYMVAE